MQTTITLEEASSLRQALANIIDGRRQPLIRTADDGTEEQVEQLVPYPLQKRTLYAYRRSMRALKALAQEFADGREDLLQSFGEEREIDGQTRTIIPKEKVQEFQKNLRFLARSERTADLHTVTFAEAAEDEDGRPINYPAAEFDILWLMIRDDDQKERADD